MSDKTTTSGAGGIGFCTVLFIIFLVLKLCGRINWSWWWVTAPLWIPWAILVVIGVIALIGCLVYWAVRRKGK